MALTAGHVEIDDPFRGGHVRRQRLGLAGGRRRSREPIGKQAHAEERLRGARDEGATGKFVAENGCVCQDTHGGSTVEKKLAGIDEGEDEILD